MKIQEHLNSSIAIAQAYYDELMLNYQRQIDKLNTENEALYKRVEELEKSKTSTPPDKPKYWGVTVHNNGEIKGYLSQWYPLNKSIFNKVDYFLPDTKTFDQKQQWRI